MSIDTQAYLFVHFIGEERNPTDEQLYFALSRDGVHWRDLRPAGSPALTWLGGEKGVRDPHIVRDPRGGFHIVATDLSIYYRGGWGPNDGATTNGSTGLVIWDSPDLVHWSEPRLVDVASKIPDAGMAWAPEANWDPDRGQWIVFWSTKSNAESSADPLANELGDPTNVYYATTVDFRCFSDPVKWIDRKNVIIDSTMLRDMTAGGTARPRTRKSPSNAPVTRMRRPTRCCAPTTRMSGRMWARSPTSSAMAGIPCTTWKGRNCSVTTTKT